MRTFVLAGTVALVSSFLSAAGTVIPQPVVRGERPIQLKRIPKLGTILNVKRASSTVMAVASAQSYPTYSARAQGLDITVGVDDNRRVRWVSTSDPDFVSPEGLRVGDPIAQAIAVAGEPLFGEPGWAWHVRLPSGWHARVNPIVETPDGLKFSFPQHDQPDPPADAVIGDFFMRN